MIKELKFIFSKNPLKRFLVFKEMKRSSYQEGFKKGYGAGKNLHDEECFAKKEPENTVFEPMSPKDIEINHANLD